MKAKKLTLDMSDNPKLLELLRVQAATKGISQKSIIVDALNSYFSAHQENLLLLKSAEKTFAEWDNEEDSAYDAL